MNYPECMPADFTKIGYEYRDACSLPTNRLQTQYFDVEDADVILTRILFHHAGDECLRVGYVDDLVNDAEFVEGLSPHDALKLGIAYAREKMRAQEKAAEART